MDLGRGRRRDGGDHRLCAGAARRHRLRRGAAGGHGVYAPVSGTVTESNGALESDPALVNSAPEGEGWFFKLTLSDPSQLEGLMDADAYKAFVDSL
jgi:hypothetical protein